MKLKYGAVAGFLFVGILALIVAFWRVPAAKAAGSPDTTSVELLLSQIGLKVSDISDDVHTLARSQARSGSSVASASDYYHVTKVPPGGSVSVSGAVQGFSCTADVDGNLDKDGGRISSDVQCFVLSR
jgi:hypothetical protein